MYRTTKRDLESAQRRGRQVRIVGLANAAASHASITRRWDPSQGIRGNGMQQVRE